MFTPDINADIVPDESLGGLKLRADATTLELGTVRETTETEHQYRLADGALDVWVDRRNNKVFMLVARRGYRGKLFGFVSVGMAAQEVLRDDRFGFDAHEGFIVAVNTPGLALNLPHPDPTPAHLKTLPIDTINVFAREILTADGQDGNW